MEFKKFASLENTYKEKVIDHIRLNHGKGYWWVSEKIDGANFSIWMNAQETKFASRNQWVDSNFYGAEKAILDTASKMQELFKAHNLSEFVVYGELYGEGIQKRINYGGKKFAAFDIVVNGEHLSFYEMECVCNTYDIDMVPVIGVGFTLDQALDQQEVFNSYLSPTRDEAEGISIAPIVPTWSGNGSRVWLKKKSPRFSEKSVSKRPKPITQLEDSDLEVLNGLLEYVNDNRVLSAISKHGTVTSKDFGKILGMVMQDIFDEAASDGFGVSQAKELDNWKGISKALQKEVQDCVRETFVRVI